jgi:hypothetical protein
VEGNSVIQLQRFHGRGFSHAIRSPLSDGQDENAAGSTARAAKVAGVAAWSPDRHVCGSRSGDQVGCDRDLQMLTAHDRSV